MRAVAPSAWALSTIICSGPRPLESVGRLRKGGTKNGWKRSCSDLRDPEPVIPTNLLPTSPPSTNRSSGIGMSRCNCYGKSWEEYRQANSDGYGYSRFCELYQRWRSKLDVVLCQEHKAGEKMFVDWAGTPIPLHDPRGGAESLWFIRRPSQGSYRPEVV